MEEKLIEFDTAILAKERGFNVEVSKGYYKHGDIKLLLWIDSENHNDQEDFLCVAPTQALLQKWLREEHKLYVTVDVCAYNEEGRYSAKLSGHGKEGFMPVLLDGFTIYSTYEDALEEGLRESLELLEHNK